MGQYTCFVILKPDGFPDPRIKTAWTTEQETRVKQHIAKLMERYDSNLPTAPWKQKCYCGDLMAVMIAKDMAERVLPIKKIAEQYRQRVAFLYPEAAAKLEQHDWNATSCLTQQEEYDVNQIWTNTVQERVELEQEIKQAHVLSGKPDKDCTVCHGTGIKMVDYNPDSRWEEWTINGSVKHNVMDHLDAQVKCETQMPYCLVTPDGEWHEHDHDAAPAVWKAKTLETLDRHRDCLVVPIVCRV